MPQKIPGALTIAGQTGQEITKFIYPKAKAVIATGSCSSYGNIQASKPNPSGAVGIQQLLNELGIADPAKPVVNMPRCPGNGEDLVAALVYVLVNNAAPELDTIGRPKFLYGELIHDHCERRGHYENGQFIEAFGAASSGEAEWCWYKLGCRGPQTWAPCPKTKWNGHISWCVNNGPCIGCAEPHFWDRNEPFTSRDQAYFAPGFGAVNAQTVTWILGGITVVGLAAHLAGQAATGRLKRQPEAVPTDAQRARMQRENGGPGSAGSSTTPPEGRA